MRSQRQTASGQNSPLWLRLIGRNIPIVIFLILATAGMIIVYWFFSPVVDNDAEAIAAGTGALSAPIYKALPDKPVLQRLAQSPGPIRIGLISGHKESDSGAVCADGLTEAELNLALVEKIAATLRAEGVHTDILDEFDSRLGRYGATAVISVHADSCDYINDLATGYKIAGSSLTDSTSLSTCVEQTYQAHTQLPYHANTITRHMTDYHVFRTLPVGVPAIIIEVGFMNLDRELLTTQSDIPALGITNGILCYLDQIQ
ncbi:MAG: N-acetylmuramoyl-L-alanine amidase [Chloroflexi bacterium]|nr:N-acetylmuramoyl-L-alanine amidase [Chloroflexota bacterium]